jgi:hypothetical protein
MNSIRIMKGLCQVSGSLATDIARDTKKPLCPAPKKTQTSHAKLRVHLRNLPLHVVGKGAIRMASIADELHDSLRREAQKLLDDAAAMTEPSRRHAFLTRAFCLIQQAEIYRQETTENPSLPTHSVSPLEKGKPPAAKTMPGAVIVAREAGL